jgi:hypothetical protein
VSTGFYFRHPSLRGFWTRTLSMLLGLVIASVLIVGMQLPLLHRPSQSRVVLHRRATSSRGRAWAAPRS